MDHDRLIPESDHGKLNDFQTMPLKHAVKPAAALDFRPYFFVLRNFSGTDPACPWSGNCAGGGVMVSVAEALVMELGRDGKKQAHTDFG